MRIRRRVASRAAVVFGVALLLLAASSLTYRTMQNPVRVWYAGVLAVQSPHVGALVESAVREILRNASDTWGSVSPSVLAFQFKDLLPWNWFKKKKKHRQAPVPAASGGGTGANAPPRANAGPDQSDVLVGTAVYLDGSASTDPDGDPLTYAWTLVDKPAGSSAVLGGDRTVRPSLILDRPGTYTIQLVVSDGRANSQPDTVLVLTPDTAPEANAGRAQHAKVDSLTSLDGSASFDADGDLITFAWELLQAPAGSTAVLDDVTVPNPRFTPDLPGDYQFRLIVSDGMLFSSPAETTVHAEDAIVAPNARAGDDQFALVGAPVTLDGSASSDPNGLSVDYLWTFLNKPIGSKLTDLDISSAETAQAGFVPDVVGTFILTLRVYNGFVGDDDTVAVLASESNVPPNADAGPRQAVRVNDETTLDGTASSDPDSGPKPLSFSWSLVSRPPGSTQTTSDIRDATTAAARFAPATQGAYVVRLNVSDGVSSDEDNVEVVADDGPPTLAFTHPANGTVVETSRPSFQVVYADDLGGINLDSLQLRVNGVDVTVATVVTPTEATYTPASALPAGDNQASAQIADWAGNVQTASTGFTVSVFRAIADCAPTTGEAPLAVRFRTRAEFTGGSIVRYRWDFQGDGAFDTSDSVAQDYTRTFANVGVYNPVLEVTNNLGEAATATCAIAVTARPPAATAKASPTNGPVPLTVTFTGQGSKENGTIVLHEWDFDGDGVFDFSTSTFTSPVQHTYSAEGSFKALFRVTDDQGLTATASVTTTAVRVGPPGSPVVQGIASPASGTGPLTVRFDGTATDDGTIVLWEWDFDGDGSYDFSSSASAATAHTYTQAGVFAAALRATDDQGLSSVDLVEIAVDLTATLAIPNDTFEPSAGKTALVNTTLSVGAPVRVVLKNADGAVVRTLFGGTRAAGSYSDAWDGRGDGGVLLPQSPYYAVLEYQVGGVWRSLDLTNKTGGARYNPARNSLPRTFSPFKNDPLTITFTIPASSGASEIEAFVGLFNADTRFVTLLDRVPLGVGTHTIYWDGLDAQGNFAVPPPGDQFLFGIWGYALPDNAIFLKAAPVITNVTVTPNYFDPSTPNFITPANPVAKVAFNLDKTAQVELTVTNLKTAKVLRRIRVLNQPAGAGLIEWDGGTDDGLFADAGDYRLSLRAIDSTDSQSLVRYALVRVFY